MSGVPSGGERLARAKETAQMWLDDEREFEDPVVALWHVQGRVLARDVLALVEIAKAAHDTVDAYEADVAWEDLRVTELAAALARLDSGAAEGDT